MKIPWLLSFSFMQLTGLSEADKEALFLILRAAMVMDDIFYLQVLFSYISKMFNMP